MDIEKRLMRTFLIVAVGLTIGGIVAYAQIYFGMQGSNATVINKGSSPSGVAGINLGGPYSLTDHTGKAVTQEDYAGQYKFIYFGFTFCPAVCPTELQRIAQVMNALPEEKAQVVQPIFISVDPERDTVEVMNDYVALFHPRLVGLTGTPEQVDAVKKSYRVYASKVPTDDGEYTVDHSSFLYFMGPDDKALGLFRMQDSVEFMTAEIEKLVE